MSTFQVIKHESIPLSYSHPYFFTRSKDNQTVYAWSEYESSHEPISLDIAGSGITHLEPRIFAEQYILIYENNTLFARSLLLFNVKDGSLSDTKQIVSDSDPENASHPPIQGDLAFLDASNDLVAIFKNGTGPKDSVVEIYGVSSEGKFTLKNELKQPSDGPALVEDVNLKTYAPSGYMLPTPFYFDEKTFIGGFGGHNVQFVKWSSEPSDPSTLELPGSRSIPGTNLESWLNDKLYISSSNSLITAHHEFPLDFVDLAPVTSVRAVNPSTLEFTWCSPIAHNTQRLRYNSKLNVLVSIGCAGERDPTSNEAPPSTGIFVLDAETGAVRRKVVTNAKCATSPSVDEIVVVYDDGRVVVLSLSSFIEGGIPGETQDTEASTPGPAFELPAFYPDLEPETSLNSKGRAKEKKQAEKYAALGQARPWVRDVYVGDGVVLLKGVDKSGYVAVRWK